MNVNFYATLRRISGEKTVDLELPDRPTVRDLMDAVFRRFPDMKKELLDEEGNIQVKAHVFVDGKNALYLERELDTPLRGTEKIDIFPMVGGG